MDRRGAAAGPRGPWPLPACWACRDCSSPSRYGCGGLAAFLDPVRQSSGANDQANAGMFAIASGGWWGVGLGASRQKWGGLPEAHTDFIFAVIGEEFGLVRQPRRARDDRRSGLRRAPDREPLR